MEVKRLLKSELGWNKEVVWRTGFLNVNLTVVAIIDHDNMNDSDS